MSDPRVRWEGFNSNEWWWPSEVQAEVADNPVVARLYGPNGEVLFELHERPEVPFGFQPREGTRREIDA